MEKLFEVKMHDSPKKKRVMTSFHFQLILLLFLSITLVGNAMSSDGGFMTLLKPIEKISTVHKDFSSISKEVYEIRKGLVSLNTQIFSQRFTEDMATSEGLPILIRGKTVRVSFFDDKNFDVVIERENKLDNNTILLSGKIVDSELSTFTLTLTTESYIINLQDLSNSMLYRIVGNSSTGIGIVTEIDQKKIPPMIHLPPIIPPAN